MLKKIDLICLYIPYIQLDTNILVANSYRHPYKGHNSLILEISLRLSCLSPLMLNEVYISDIFSLIYLVLGS